MKSFKSYVLEKCEEKNCKESTFTFDFTGINNSEEIVKGLEAIDNVTVDGAKVEVKVCKGCDIDTLQDIMQQTIEMIRKDNKNFSDENYAQKTKKISKTFNKMVDFVEQEDGGEDTKEEE